MSQDKKIEDYLHLYLGCECECVKSMPVSYGWEAGMRTKTDNDILWDMYQTVYVKGEIVGKWYDYFKPILRPLSDMSEEEKDDFAESGYGFEDEDNRQLPVNIWKGVNMSEHVLWLLSNHFDIFSLHEAGLCLYKTDLK